MNNNLRMSGAMFLMLKKSSDRRQREALEAAFKVNSLLSLLDNAPNYLVGCLIQKRIINQFFLSKYPCKEYRSHDRNFLFSSKASLSMGCHFVLL